MITGESFIAKTNVTATEHGTSLAVRLEGLILSQWLISAPNEETAIMISASNGYVGSTIVVSRADLYELLGLLPDPGDAGTVYAEGAFCRVFGPGMLAPVDEIPIRRNFSTVDLVTKIRRDLGMDKTDE